MPLSRPPVLPAQAVIVSLGISMTTDCTPPTPLLSGLSGPQDVASLSPEQLAALAEELRSAIIATVSRTGGHLAPSLGVVELTLALCCCFDPGMDRIVWDVGHQTYAYKLLTGRAENFHTLRQHGGVCGFPLRDESVYDHFGVGHSSTSISAALGMAVARDLAGEKHHVLAVIGDGSMTAGLAYEGLNQAGATGKKLIVVLNDNEMSISKNVGALSFFLSRNLSAPWVRRTKREVEGFLESIPGIGQDLRDLAKKSQHSLKGFFTPGMLFEAFRFNYMGPVDGHDLKALTKAFEVAKQVDKPVLVHVLTTKGKGYAPAEANPVHFHGVGRFSPETGVCATAPSAPPSYTKVFGKTLTELAEQDKRIVAITAAMPEGTGLAAFAKKFPERFVDVGICEQHAVTFAAGLAAQGLRPVVAVYSTFLQRSYDQIVHDVCLQNLPVLFGIDRAGLVGEDGATHQGMFDIAFMRHIPNMAMLAPKDEAELQRALVTALAHDGPMSIRYPRGAGLGVPLYQNVHAIPPLPPGEAELLVQGDGSLAVLALGNTVEPALAAAKMLQEQCCAKVSICNARWVKPLAEEAILRLADSHAALLTVEEAVLHGGFGSAVLGLLARSGRHAVPARCLALPDLFIEHGPAALLRKKYSLDAEGICKILREMLPSCEKKR